jgi:hypothetical protein
MFDRQFFATILPEHVRTTVAAHPGKVPVIEMHLGDRTVLDLCYIVRLADTWVAVAHYCREDAFDDYDVAFVPYGTIVRVSLTMKHDADRHLGFRTDSRPIDTPPDDEPAGLVIPHTSAVPNG